MQHETASNDFEELLAVLNDEELIRVRHRLNKRRKMRLVDIITEERAKREAAWKEEKRA